MNIGNNAGRVTDPLAEERRVTADHLGRKALLYVRQSTVRQVFENTESTARQYALRDRAVSLGWPGDKVEVIDSDLGRSGAESDREGFQKLVTEVSLGRVGIVLGLEVSRLARNSADWHRLLEFCGVTDTLILDEDGVYNPREFNDRLLLGLKGTLSEAELHMLKARLLGGLLNKARRGELKLRLPVGLLYDPLDRVMLDPDAQVQQSLRLLFDTFERKGSATATVRYFADKGLEFPSRVRSGVRKGELHWQPLTHGRTLQVLHNPRYAGAFAYGRRRQRRQPDGSVRTVNLPPEDWIVLLPGHHAGYISWERYEANRQQLREMAQAHGAERRKSPPREGPALLQGLAVCGVCGRRMTVHYHVRQGRRVPTYRCQTEGVEQAKAVCQGIPGAGIDRAVGALLVELMTPATLEVALQVQQELERRAAEADQWHARKVQRAQQEVELALLRFRKVHPSDELVFPFVQDELRERARELKAAQRERERCQARDRRRLAERERERILALATDFPRLWNDPATPDRERKRMARLLLEDVTLTRGEAIALGVRLRGGATRELTVEPEPRVWERDRTPAALIAEIDELLDSHTDGAVARLLNERGRRPRKGGTFTARRVQRVRRTYKLRTRYERLRKRGLLRLAEMAERLRVSTGTVRAWRDKGRLTAHVFNGRGECLYEWPEDPPRSQRRAKRDAANPADRAQEVQYEV